MNQSKPTSAYTDTHTIKCAPLRCPYCEHELRAQDVEPLDAGDVRLICPGCYAAVLTIER
jgi:hypothetical protein